MFAEHPLVRIRPAPTSSAAFIAAKYSSAMSPGNADGTLILIHVRMNIAQLLLHANNAALGISLSNS
jgi:hypothetical protein